MMKVRKKKNREKSGCRKCAKAFFHAFAGIRLMLVREHNARIHCIVTFVVIVCGFIVGLSDMEWAAVSLCIGGVFVSEALNTAIEVIADRVSPEFDDAIGKCKDLAAGAVLLAAIIAMVVGLMVFGPKFVSYI